MDQWSEGGGFFNDDTQASASKSKPAARQQFLCPATIRQVLEAPEEGLKFGENNTTMVTIIGIIMDVRTSSTKIQFTISDDTGVMECTDWIESDDAGDSKSKESLMENSYYQVFGSIKSPQGNRHIIVFKVTPIEDFNLITAHMAEILTVTRLAQKAALGNDQFEGKSYGDMTSSHTSYNPTKSATNGHHEVNTRFKPEEQEILNIIKNTTAQVGWHKNDPNVLRKYSANQIDNIVSFLAGEGLIYNTIDEDHYCGTGN